MGRASVYDKLIAGKCVEDASAPTHFSAINLSYFTLYLLNSPWIYIKSQTFQKIIRLLADHNSIYTLQFICQTLQTTKRNQNTINYLQHTTTIQFTLTNLYVKHFTPLNAIKIL